LEQQKFDSLTKTLATPVSRGTALKAVFATALGGALGAGSVVGVGAASPSTGKCSKCSTPGNCTNGFNQCGNQSCGHSGLGTYCFQDANGKGFCGANTFCTKAPTCTNDKNCPKGSKCIINQGCSGCASSPGNCVETCAYSCKHGSSSRAQGSGRTAINRS